jgi:phosphoglycerate dehydrogenase-like enzyme
MLKGVYFCAKSSWDRVYGAAERKDLSRLIDIPPLLVTRENWREHRGLLKEADVIVSSWGGAILSEELLEAMPKLKLYLYGAGHLNGIMSEAAWNRGIRVTTANPANAIPVAEFVLAQIIFSLKRGWEYMDRAKRHAPELWGTNKFVAGMYGSRVGIVSIGQISTRLIQLLRHFEVTICASCPDTTPQQAAALGIELMDLEEVFASCDVVSLHLRSCRSTRGLINGDLLNRMKAKATLINTARGEIMHQEDLVEFLAKRPDVYACIDVTDPEPPPGDSKLLSLPNVILTPHLAGSMHTESLRLGRYMIEELKRYLNDQPLIAEVTRELVERTESHFNQTS